MKNFILKSIFVWSLILSLTACASNQEDPQINPDPKYFLTIHGYIDPALKDKIYLSFLESFTATNKQCLKDTNWLAGIQGMPSKTDFYSVNPDDKGNYTLVIPIDKYLSGYCQWDVFWINYIVQSNNIKLNSNWTEGEGFIGFNNDNEKYNPNTYNLICANTPESCRVKINDGGSLFLNLQKNKSEKIIFNLLSRE